MSNAITIAIGALAQILFSSRIILQWILSEKSRRVLTPLLFWELSLVASFLLFIYGYLRNDFAIMLGQSLTYYIYIRNIQLQKQWKKIHPFLRLFIYIFPVIIIIYGYNNERYDINNLFNDDTISTPLLFLGIISQLLFTFRFIYQWLYSERKKESSLPLGFWVISLLGSGLILIYAVFRLDPILFIGHLIGFTAYARNIIIIKKNNPHSEQ
ncbi:lipid-A-disaccharide synthase N-terminal domain-containing protein [Flavobacterium luminosum]|uniref:Lipid-A-disaccharide synthase N-terminal domain-containing protein n=1 Tax=Flavobacterium luminosum TaxID=2949086 RepID=A0ABT0TNV5_9FLAO|nr:lipid-A-disaccharide synthase N-terminal domain-containing protein [Flavobacterium sp. HXWNR70]MCL9808951.1 lipid-A-disaccharide synthase N-terminal domain-containing protein [Flavobacterium sp. HXWNR70]